VKCETSPVRVRSELHAKGSICKGPEVRVCLACFMTKEANIPVNLETYE
jgi:hypothetical protein